MTFGLPSLPPREEWGSNEHFRRFKQTKKGKVPRCQSFSRTQIRKGKRGADAQCPLSARKGYKHCHRHGGKSGRPYNVKDELDVYARALPDDIKGTYLAMISDPSLLSHRKEAQVLQARIVQVMKRIDSGESSKAWVEVGQAEVVFRQALKEKDPADLMRGLTTAHRMLREALRKADYTIWHELESLLHSKSRLVTAENKHLIDQQLVMSVEELVAIAATLNAGLFKIVTDHQQRLLITELFRATFFAGESGAPLPHEVTPDWVIEGKERGCYICRHKFFRHRNKNERGEYRCIHCNTLWEAGENDDKDDRLLEGTVTRTIAPPAVDTSGAGGASERGGGGDAAGGSGSTVDQPAPSGGHGRRRRPHRNPRHEPRGDGVAPPRGTSKKRRRKAGRTRRTR